MAESDAPQDVKGELAEMIRSFLGKKLDAVPPGLRTEISGTTYTVHGEGPMQSIVVTIDDGEMSAMDSVPLGAEMDGLGLGPEMGGPEMGLEGGPEMGEPDLGLGPQAEDSPMQ